MREIEFRAWHKSENKMIRSIGFTDSDIGRTWRREHYMIDDGSFDDFNSGELEIMQYTGLKDKNGVKIFESDYIQFLDHNTYYEVVWSMGGFHAMPLISSTDSSAKDWKGVGYTDCEVVGNKYEN